MEEGEDEEEENSGGATVADNAMEEMVGPIEEVAPLLAEEAATEEMEGETVAEEETMEYGATNAAGEEGEVAKTQEIIPQVIEIETSLEIKGTLIEEEEPLV